MRTELLALFCFLAILFGGCEQKKAISGDGDSAFSLASKPMDSGLNLMLFGAFNCGGCDAMRSYIANSVAIKEALNGVNIYYVIGDQSYKIFLDGENLALNSSELKERFKIYGAPTLVALNKGKMILYYAGFMSEKRFLAMLKTLKELDSDDQVATEMRLKEIFVKESV